MTKTQYSSSSISAFTLIEMLIVIVIIGILAAAIIPRLQSLEGRARDTKRISDIRDIQNALEIHYADHAKYPASHAPAGCGVGATIPNTSYCNSVQRKPDGRWLANGALAPYITQDPIDPKPHPTPLRGDDATTNRNGGTYFYGANGIYGCQAGQYYRIVAGMEIPSNRQKTYFGCNGSPYTDGGSYIVGKSIR